VGPNSILPGSISVESYGSAGQGSEERASRTEKSHTKKDSQRRVLRGGPVVECRIQGISVSRVVKKLNDWQKGEMRMFIAMLLQEDEKELNVENLDF